MGFIEEILGNLLVFQIVTDIISVTIGASLCIGALKWRRGLLTTTAMGWGFVLGVIAVMLLGDVLDQTEAIFCVLLGVIGLPILTYTVPGVNRFVLGFIVSCKLFFMLTTVLAKEGCISIEETIIIPLVAGTIVGVILMAWTRMRVFAFVFGCSFIGASEIAPVISEWINRILFATTGDIGYLVDPVDLLFALLKIELTDVWTFLALILFMSLGIYRQINDLKTKGIALDTPIIGFEVPRKDNGKINFK